MKKLELMLPTMISAVSCLAQTNQPAIPAPAWEHSTNQVHMTAYITNAVVAPGLDVQVLVRISNASTNELGVLRRDSGDGELPRLRIELISESGQIYTLATGEATRPIGVMPTPQFAGTTNEWKVPVDITTNIASGNYKLRLTQLVFFMGGDCQRGFELQAIAQTNQPAFPLSAWEILTNQVHMSALVSNNVVATGSKADVLVRISNTSTNELGVLQRDFGDLNLPSVRIDLISGSGQIYKLATGDPTQPFSGGIFEVFHG
jgi:hypothetical protein